MRCIFHDQTQHLFVQLRQQVEAAANCPCQKVSSVPVPRQPDEILALVEQTIAGAEDAVSDQDPP
jgi:hypothetical protein